MIDSRLQFALCFDLWRRPKFATKLSVITFNLCYYLPGC
jgi:hypothetical protein